MSLLTDMKLYQNTCPIISLIKTQFQSSGYIEQEEIALHGLLLAVASVTVASGTNKIEQASLCSKSMEGVVESV